MSPRNWQDRLRDILACADNIIAFTAGMELEIFSNDPKTIRAVAFELTTIGEAARAIPGEIQDRFPEIPWGRLLGIRNVLVHEYFRIDEEILWNTAMVDIPQLATQISKILE